MKRYYYKLVDGILVEVERKEFTKSFNKAIKPFYSDNVELLSDMMDCRYRARYMFDSEYGCYTVTNFDILENN